MFCRVNSYSANLGRTKKYINKSVIKLHIKRKRKEIQQHTNSSTGVLLLGKKKPKIKMEV